MVPRPRPIADWRVFRSDVPSLARRFADGLAACYAGFGVTVADEVLADDVVCVALVQGDRLLAGLRLHPRGVAPLPIERRLCHPPLTVRLGALGAVAEVAALWSSPEVRGTGIGAAVVAAGVRAADDLGWGHLVALGHQHNRFPPAVGFVPDRALGEFPYPDPRYRSVVHWRTPSDPSEAR